MVETITVSSRGQIVIPEKVRKQLDIKTGSKLFLFEKNGTLILKREEQIARQLDEDDQKEQHAWLALAEHALSEMWDNPKDEEAWKRYL